MIVLGLAIAGFLLALIPLLFFLRNLAAFSRLPLAANSQLLAPVSVLIPARNEADSIAGAVESVLASRGVQLELIVLDDSSEDDTAQIVEQFAARDSRLRLLRSPPLPKGWCGKQHACHQLSLAARHDLLVWIDADVRLRDDALQRIASEMQRAPLSLLSGFPREQTNSFLERLLLPLIHFVLLGYCPIWMMRRSKFPGLGAGCGQLFAANKTDYLAAGGHEAIKASLHDGIALPRALRRAGFFTGLFDASDVAECRMYQSAAATWQGLLKNAGEGLATPRAVVPWTLILLLGQVLPFVLMAWLLISGASRSPDATHRVALCLAVMACCGSIAIRVASSVRFRQPLMIALLHPLAVFVLLLIQWQAVGLRFCRKGTNWRGREYPVDALQNPG